MPYAELSSAGASPYLVLLLVTVTLGTVYLLLLVLFGLLRFCKRAQSSGSRVLRLQHLVRAHLTRQRRARLSLKRKALLVCYLCFRAFYNFLFTFSVIVSLILSLESASVLRLQALASSQKALLDDFRIHFDRLESFGTSELQRQLEQALRMHRACDLSVGATLGNLTQSYEADLGQLLTNIYASSVSLANQTQRVINWKYTAFRHRLERFVDSHKLRMSEAIKVQYAPYGSLLRKAYHCPWLNLPLRLFNGTKNQFVDSLFDYALRPSNLRQPHVDFMSFMYVHEAEALHLLPTKLWKKLDSALPSTAPLKIRPLAPARPALSALPTARQLQAHRFFGSLGRPDRHGGPPGAPPQRALRLASKVFSYPISLLRIRFFLLLLDLVIIVYRFYHTYATAKVLWNGRPVSLSDDDLAALLTNDQLAQELRPRTRPAPGIDLIAAARPVRPPGPEPDPRDTSSHHRRREGTACARRAACCLSLHFLALVIGFAVTAAAFYLLTAFDANFYPGRLLASGKFFRRLTTLEANRRVVNRLVAEHAQVVNGRHLPSYRHTNHYVNERLLSLAKRYEHEKTNVRRQYQAEMCSIDRSLCGHGADSSPILSISPPLACGFLSVKAINYTEYYLSLVNSAMFDSGIYLEVRAARALVFTVAVVLLVTFAILAVLHLSGVLCLRWLSLPLVPVRRTADLPASQDDVAGAPAANSDTQESRV